MESVFINHTKLTNYRNYGSARAEFGKGFNLFTGENGAGKTSLLDALYYASCGRSYFASRDQYIYKEGSDIFRIEASISLGDHKCPVAIKSPLNGRKEISMDGKTQSRIMDYYGFFPSVMIAPKDIQIIIESSLERRKIIDRTLSKVDKKYFESIVRYNRILKQRNQALKAMRKSERYDTTLIHSFDKAMAPLAANIHSARSEYITHIGPVVNAYYDKLADEKETLSLYYKSQLNDEAFDHLMEANNEKDRITCKTNAGIHRDDMTIKLSGQDIKQYASQGQLKSAIIAVKLAQVEWLQRFSHKKPVIFLDDICDKLDEYRVGRLLDLIYETWATQVFVTDTDNERIRRNLELRGYPYRCFLIQNGQIVDQ